MKHLRQLRFIAVGLIVTLVVMILLGTEYRLSKANNISLEPQFSLPAGYYDNDLWLEINIAHPDAKVYFTMDGRVPDPVTGTLYTQPIPMSAAAPNVAVIRARAFLPDGIAGSVVSTSYALNVNASLPMLSLIIAPQDFWGSERGINVNHIERGQEWERPVDITYIAGDKQNSFHIGAGIRIHGGWSRYFYEKKSFRLYFRTEYGVAKLNYPLFGLEGQTEFDHLVLHNSGMDLLLFKNQLVDHLTKEMGGYATRSQPTLVFINGRSWGIYNIRERINERFFAENYAIPGVDISDTPNNRGHQSPEEQAVDTVHWEHFMAFVLENDLSLPENYAYLQTQIDLANFIDYYLLQMYIANTDWPHHNVHQFRPRTQGGRWEWIVWDNDFAFDLANRQMVDHVLSPGHPLGERMVIFLNKLLENPEFRNLFVTRLADLLNTSLAPSQTTDQVAQLAAELKADIDEEQARWFINKEWDLIVSHMYDFVQQRPEIMRRHMASSLGLPGTAQITFEGVAGKSGWVVVNEMEPQLLPWKGEYFEGTTIRLQAVPAPGFVFSEWEGVSGEATAESDVIHWHVSGDIVLKPRFSPAAKTRSQPGDVIISAFHVDDEGDIYGDWVEMVIQSEDSVDLRGWRLTDNDNAAATDEGSLIFVDDPLLEMIPTGSRVRVIATPAKQNDTQFSEDGWRDGVLVLYVQNGRINTQRDPWFNLGPHDNLAVLAPGLTSDLFDDVAVDLWTENVAVKPAAFGLPPE